jgi:hypothetical protein
MRHDDIETTIKPLPFLEVNSTKQRLAARSRTPAALTSTTKANSFVILNFFHKKRVF